MKIRIKVIPHKSQRDAITGQWWFDKKGVLQIRISELGNLDYIKLHIIHELFEAFACTYNKGVTDSSTERFDKAFVAKRKRGEVPEHITEPGFDPECPYKVEHAAATGVELLLSTFLNVNWSDYEKRCREVSWEGKLFGEEV